MSQTSLKTGLFILLGAVSNIALAHPGHEQTSSFISGLGHPVAGLDHLLAMVAVGLWAASLGGKALFTVPTMFVASMIIGAMLAIGGVHVPMVEQGILLSVILLGALLFSAKRLPVYVCAAITAIFALFHGAAHGVEMPLAVSSLQYILGFAVATLGLHLVGVGFGHFIQRINTPIVSRISGAMIGALGLLLAFN